MNKPIKRNEALQPLSREHHHGLLFCWKLRKGLKEKVDLGRMKRYADWFYSNQLLPHFETEEKHVFPVLGNEHKWVKQALAEHQELRQLFDKAAPLHSTLGAIEEKLEAHIRFEERFLFNEIQQKASKAEIEALEVLHAGPGNRREFEDWKDEFWK